MAIELQHTVFMPSGVPAGSELAPAFRQSLEHLAGVPLALQPVVEDGTYDEIKACVFRVLSYRVCEVAMEDIVVECRAQDINCTVARRQWQYAQGPLPKLFTTVDMRMTMDNHPDIQDFLEYLARKFNFRYNRISVNRKRCTQSPLKKVQGVGQSGAVDKPTDYLFLDPSTEVEAEIVWPYWT